MQMAHVRLGRAVSAVQARLVSLSQSRWVGTPVGHTRSPPLPAPLQALACAGPALGELPLAGPWPGRPTPGSQATLAPWRGNSPGHLTAWLP